MTEPARVQAAHRQQTHDPIHQAPMKGAPTLHRLEDPRHLCPNCARRFADLTSPEHTDSGCFLGMLVGVIQDRGEVQVTSVALAAFESTDGLWDRWGGPATDELERALRSGEAAGGRPMTRCKRAVARNPLTKGGKVHDR